MLQFFSGDLKDPATKLNMFSTQPKLSLRHVKTFIEKRKTKTKCFPCLLERNFAQKRVPM